MTRRRQESGGPVGAVQENQEGTSGMHFEAKKVIVVGVTGAILNVDGGIMAGRN
jgi:hypothetical protein